MQFNEQDKHKKHTFVYNDKVAKTHKQTKT